MFEDFLVEIGLSEKEASVYLSLLQFDSATIPQIAEHTNVKRTTIYPVLETLQKKGLVSEVTSEKKISYHAESPERLETYINRQKVMLDEQSIRLKDLVPQLKSIQRETGERPIIKLFEGRDGAISAYTEFFDFPSKIKKDAYYIINSDLLAEVFTEKEMNHFREIRKGKKIESLIVYNNQSGERPFEMNKGALRINEKEYPISCDIAVLDDMVVISTLGRKINSFLIKSKDIAETLTSIIRYVNEKK